MTYREFCRTGIDLSALSVDMKTPSEPYFCTPAGAEIFGRAGVDGIHYCFLPDFGETVFAVSPMNGAGERVHPIAASFEDLLRLLLACGDAAALEQAWQWDEAQFQAFLGEIEADAAALDALRGLGLAPMPQPWQYLKALRERLAAQLPPEREPGEDEAELPEWRVYYGRGFWHGAEDGAPCGERPLGHRFRWGDAEWQALAVYVGEEGLVLDLAKQVPAEAVRRFAEKWAPLEGAELTPEQNEQVMRGSPFHDEIRAELVLNGRVLRSRGGCGFAWSPDAEQDAAERTVIEHYALDPAENWQLWRFHFPCSRPELRTLTLQLAAQPVWLPGPRFTAQPGLRLPFRHPASGKAYMLRVLALAPEAVEAAALPAFAAYPTQCVRMEYTVSPELSPSVFCIRDAAPGDPPRMKRPADAGGAVPVGGAACIGIIGGADGPSRVFVTGGRPEGRQLACSSLYFELPERIEWQAECAVVPRGEISEKLL